MVTGALHTKEWRWVSVSCLGTLLALLPFVLTLRGSGHTRSQQKQPDEVHQLWSAVIDPDLRAKVQTTDQAQTLGAVLMVPLHAAFHRRDEAWIQSFAAQFSQFASDPSTLPSAPSAELSRLYYLYVASRFMVLAKESGRQDLIPRGLPELLYSEVQANWRTKPAWQWDRQPFPGGARERVLWKLDHRKVGKSYYRVILDEDLYNFAIAADLKAFGGTAAQQEAWNPLLEDVLSVVRRVFTQEVVQQPGGGWLFQPGVWTDHPEYLYAGNKEPRPGLKPAPVRGIGEDSSHSLRLPLWLTSFMQAYPVNSEEYHFYQNLLKGLEEQFYNKVLVQPTAGLPCFLTNNFMDGSNGVYRWNYGSFGKDNGYGPYQTSGAFLLGWAAFLNTDRIRAVYREVAAQFPWSRQCNELYLGPHPASGPFPASAFDANSSSMRLRHLNVELAATL
jgi:hypothetical protein